MGYTWTGGHRNIQPGPGPVAPRTDVCELHRNFANRYGVRVAVGLDVLSPPNGVQPIDIFRTQQRSSDQLSADPGVAQPGTSEMLFRGRRPTSLTCTLLPDTTLAIQLPDGADVKWEVHIFEIPIPADDPFRNSGEDGETITTGGSGGFNPWKWIASLFGK